MPYLNIFRQLLVYGCSRPHKVTTRTQQSVQFKQEFTACQITNRNSVGFINPESPMGSLLSKSSAQQTALRQHATPRPAQIPNDRPEERSSLRPEDLSKEGTTLASDSDPLFRPGTRRTSAYGSSPTGAVRADWERPTGDARSVRTQGSGGADKARRSSQPQYRGSYRAHLQDSIVRPCQKGALQPSRHVKTRTVLWAPTFVLQYGRRQHLPYQKNTMESTTCI